jgi:hypothetical protein
VSGSGRADVEEGFEFEDAVSVGVFREDAPAPAASKRCMGGEKP